MKPVISLTLIVLFLGCINQESKEAEVLSGEFTYLVKQPAIVPYLHIDGKVKNIGGEKVSRAEIECRALGENNRLEVKQKNSKKISLEPEETKDTHMEIVTRKAYDVKKIECYFTSKNTKEPKKII